MRSTASVALLLALTSSASAQFTQAPNAAGLSFDAIKEGGLTWADFNEDGFPDVVVNASGRSGLFFSDGAATPSFQNVTNTHAAGLTNRGERSAVAADVNNDGLTDLVRTGSRVLEVYLNRGAAVDPPYSLGDAAGAPQFRLPVMGDTFFEGVAVFDFDGDGWLDLVVENDQELRVFRNPTDGGATFTVVDAAMTGLPLDVDQDANGDYLAVADLDGDGFLDIAHRIDNGPALHFGDASGSFTAATPVGFVTGGGPKGGFAICDFDNDGDLDFFHAGSDDNTVWLQTAPRTFEGSGEPMGIAPSAEGPACGDIDNDGDQDLLVSKNGNDLVFLNQLTETGDLGWVEDTLGITGSENGEAVALVDYDRDGDLDAYISQLGPSVTDPVTMMSMPTAAQNELWINTDDSDAYIDIEVRLGVSACGEASITRIDHGAVVRIALADGSWSSGVHDVNGGGGHGSQSSSLLHFGLPQGLDQDYVVTWRSGLSSLPASQVTVRPASIDTPRVLSVLSSDADGDGIPSAVEQAAAVAAGGADPDGDGLDAWNDTDADGDGVDDASEAGDPCAPADSDGSGVPDFLEAPGMPPTDGGVVPTDSGTLPGDSGAPPTTGFVAHGSGFATCAVTRQSRPSPISLSLLLVLVAQRLRRRRARLPRNSAATTR